MENNKIKVCAYARFSSTNQRIESIETQLEVISKYCDNHDMEIVATYTDEAKTATNDDREGFLEMIDKSKEKKWEAIVLYSLDRFSRNAVNHYYYKNILDNYGIKIIAILDGIEGEETAETGLMENIKIGLAEYYSAHLSKVVLDSCIMTSRNYLKAGGIDNLGFNTTNKIYSINESEAIIIRKIFDLALKEYRPKEIANILNEEGYETKLGNKFTHSSITYILRNRKYDGQMVYNVYKRKKKLGSRAQSRVKKPEKDHVVIPNAIPRIIDHETFIKVQEILDRDSLYSMKYGNNASYILSGLIFCKLCGGKYQHSKSCSGRNKKERNIFRCGNGHKERGGCKGKSINADYLTEYTIFLIDKILLSKNAKKTIKSVITNKICLIRTEKEALLKNLNSELRKTNTELDKLTVVAQNSTGLARESLMKAVQVKMDETINIQIKINKLKEDIKQYETVYFADIDKVIDEYRQARIDNNKQELRRLVLMLLKRINMGDETIEFVFDLKCFTSNIREEILDIARCERGLVARKKYNIINYLN